MSVTITLNWWCRECPMRISINIFTESCNFCTRDPIKYGDDGIAPRLCPGCGNRELQDLDGAIKDGIDEALPDYKDYFIPSGTKGDDADAHKNMREAITEGKHWRKLRYAEHELALAQAGLEKLKRSAK